MNIFNINVSDLNDNCGICQCPLDGSGNQQIYCLKDCRHHFHTDCIISWFRTRNNRCPLCGNSGINHSEDVFGHFGTSVEVAPTNSIVRRSCYMNDQHKERYEMLISFSKKNDAPIILKKHVEKINKAKEKWKQHKRDIKEYKNKIHNNISIKEIQKKETQLRNLCFNSYRTYNTKKVSLINLPIIPLIIPQYIDME